MVSQPAPLPDNTAAWLDLYATTRYRIGRGMVHNGSCRQGLSRAVLLPVTEPVTCASCLNNTELAAARHAVKQRHPQWSWSAVCSEAARITRERLDTLHL